MSCYTCKYWNGEQSDKKAECHRYPPTVCIIEEQKEIEPGCYRKVAEAVFLGPITADDHHCGEWTYDGKNILER
jgi:hypothetical protein